MLKQIAQSHHSNLYKTQKVILPKGSWRRYVHLLRGGKGSRLEKILDKLKEESGRIQPHPSLLFKPYLLTPFEDVRVVMLIGGSPRFNRGDGWSDGIGFSTSVNRKGTLTRELVNFFLELKNDVRIKPPAYSSSSFSHWARHNGIFILNVGMTTNGNKRYSSCDEGRWDMLVYETLKALNYEKKEPIVFIFLGETAKKFTVCIDPEYHYILTCGHPRHRKGFIGTRIFSKSAELLKVRPDDLWSFTTRRTANGSKKLVR